MIPIKLASATPYSQFGNKDNEVRQEALTRLVV